MRKLETGKSSKQTVLFVQGHEYLFWSKGVYFLSIVSKHYDVILIVPTEYNKSHRFLNSIKQFNIKQLVYYSRSTYYGSEAPVRLRCREWLTRHFVIYKQAEEIILTHQPSIVFQNDYINIENMYFFVIAKKHNPICKRVVVSVSNPSNKNTRGTFKSARVYSSKKLSSKIGVNYKFIISLVYIFRYLVSIIDNWVFPIILTRQMPCFNISSFRNNDVKCFKKVFDEFIVDDPIDKTHYSEILNHGEKIINIKSVINSKYNNKNYSEELSVDGVVIFFSLTLGLGFKQNLEGWAQVIKALKKNSFNKICIKIHPSAKKQIVLEIESYFRLIYPNLVIYSNQKSAEELILSSKIIIGDVSSTLLWAAAIDQRIVISINIKNDPASGAMNSVPGIIYFDSFIGAIESMSNWEELNFAAKAKEKNVNQNLKELENHIVENW
jgi:hypothetical protein